MYAITHMNSLFISVTVFVWFVEVDCSVLCVTYFVAVVWDFNIEESIVNSFNPLIFVIWSLWQYVAKNVEQNCCRCIVVLGEETILGVPSVYAPKYLWCICFIIIIIIIIIITHVVIISHQILEFK
jgi:hypothetical protein